MVLSFLDLQLVLVTRDTEGETGTSTMEGMGVGSVADGDLEVMESASTSYTLVLGRGLVDWSHHLYKKLLQAVQMVELSLG